MIEVERIPPERAVMIRGGILTEGRPTGRDVRAELGIAPDAPMVVAVGMLRAREVLRRADPGRGAAAGPGSPRSSW